MGGLGSIYGATAPVRIYDAEFRNQNKGFLGTNGVCGEFCDQKWRFLGTDEVRLVGNAARRMAGRAATAAPAAGN